MNEEYISSEINALVQSVSEIKDLDDKTLEESLPLIKDQIEMRYAGELKEQAINQLIKNLEDQRLDRKEAEAALKAAEEALRELVELETMTSKQKEAAETVLSPLFTTFKEALERYHLYNITLPIKLEEGAKIPTYAHDTDACADIYALNDEEILPHTYGNKLHTGVSIELPEGWMAMIFPRSSIGAKTPLRLSNSVGIIDSGYRGELGVLYDNTSDETIKFQAGDRIAQLLVMPSYRFQPHVVETLEDSDRGEGGFGSTGT